MKNSTFTLRVATLAIFAVGLASLVGAQEFVRGRVLVKFYSDVTQNQKGQALRALNARSSRPIGSGIELVELPSISTESSVAAALSRNPKVQFAELDQRFEPGADPNDPWYSKEWYLAKISAPGAWTYSTGRSSIVIAILDSGIESSHPDLSANVIPGWNAFDGNSNTSDVYGHGTAVAGVASAVTNNGSGVSSLVWNCKIMPVRVTDLNGYAVTSSLVSGLDWAKRQGARVANVSFAVTDNQSFRSAAQAFASQGGVVTVAAGNNGVTSSAPDNPYLLTVSATDGGDRIYSWSNRGSNVDVTAPGSVYTTGTNGSIGSGAGTSYAAPIVASLAALILSVDPTLNANQVMSIIEANCDDLGTPGWDNTFASGRINARRAVEAVVGGTNPDGEAPSVSVTAPANGATVAGVVTLSANAADNVGVTEVSFWVNGSQLGTATSAPYSISWNSTSVANGSHTIAAKAVDAAGNVGTASITLTASNNSGDTTPPTVRISAPTEGTVVSGNQNVYASAADNVRVAKVELYVDGILTASSTSAPYSTKWNTRRAARGAHELKLRAYDASGNVAWSDPVQVVK